MSSPGSPSSSVVEKLDDLFGSFGSGNAPGVIVGVAQHGRVVYRQAFGMASIEHARALTPATRMRIGSTTKQFCCLGLLLLEAEGNVDLDRPVRDWLPELGAISGRPTLRQLMHHTSGLHEPLRTLFFQGGGHYPHFATGGHLQVMARQTESSFAPGSRFAYGSSGYLLLSLVTERVSGLPWTQFIEERIFHPLGMLSTTVLVSDLDIVPDMATLHVPAAEGRWRRGIYPCDENLGNGGVISTVDDMLLWCSHLRAVPKPVGSEAIWDRMLAPQAFPNGSVHSYGLGLISGLHRGVRIIHHGGATLGSTHQMLIAPAHELDIVVMANRLDFPSEAFALAALEAVLGNEHLEPLLSAPLASEHPAVLGRWFSRASKTLLEIGAHRGPADMPDRLLVSTFDQPLALLRHVGTALALPDGPFGTLELREPPLGATPPADLEVHLCGEPESFDRLPDDPPTSQSLAADFCGRYRQPGFAKEFEVALRGGQLVFDLLPLHGQGYWDLTPYADDVVGCGTYHAIPDYPLPNSASLALDRRNGCVVGFWFSTDRVRGMYFERSA